MALQTPLANLTMGPLIRIFGRPKVMTPNLEIIPPANFADDDVPTFVTRLKASSGRGLVHDIEETLPRMLSVNRLAIYIGADKCTREGRIPNQAESESD